MANSVQSTLMNAVETGNIEAVKTALAKGADVNAKDEDGWPALIWAAREGQEISKNAQLVLQKGSPKESQEVNIIAWLLSRISLQRIFLHGNV